MEKIAPLTGGFLIISILGFFLSLFMVYNKGYYSWGIAFMLVFVMMFIASFISISHMEVETLAMLDHTKKH
jgi:hypothetical protein